MSDELKYLELLERVKGEKPGPNRTGIATRSLFAETLRFNILDSIVPLLTTKKVPFKSVYVELLWFLRGDDTIEFLKKNGVKIWDGNTTRKFLDSRGLTWYEEGDVGPSYGWQWRRFGQRIGIEGVDQIQQLIDLIKKDPTDRRMVLTAWDPCNIHLVALPPCHITFVMMCTPNDKGEYVYLNGHLTMRSADLFLGVPFNIVSYSLLLHMIAKVTGKIAKELVVTMVNCHLYENHLNQVEIQIKRSVTDPPKIKFSDRIETLLSESKLTIDDFDVDDIKVEGYVSHEAIRAEMAV